MNKKKWISASIVVSVIIIVLEYIFHNVCLTNLYAATANLWRPEMEMSQLMPFGILIYLITAFLFTYIYTKGYQAKPSALGEGLRYGLIIGVFVSLPMAGWSYIVMPIPLTLSLCWFVMGMVEFLAIGAAVGLIYKK